MQFKELKKDCKIYLFDRTKIEAYEACIINVGHPYNSNDKTVVLDITANVNGKPLVYTLRTDSDIAFDTAHNILLSTERSGVIKDVEAMMVHANDALEEYQKQVKLCKEILSDF